MKCPYAEIKRVSAFGALKMSVVCTGGMTMIQENAYYVDLHCQLPALLDISRAMQARSIITSLPISDNSLPILPRVSNETFITASTRQNTAPLMGMPNTPPPDDTPSLPLRAGPNAAARLAIKRSTLG